jgi:hypothetical protein
MSSNPQVSAAAASNAYQNRPQSDVDNPNRPVYFEGQKYNVYGYKDDPSTGFHATAYQNATTHEIIIAYRGTDPDFKHHTRTTVQDALVDATMVKDKINPQEAAAHAFTQEMIDKAQKHGISKDQITVAGHSLGGTLAEIEAAKFGLHGSTYNAYGAADLGYGIAPGGHQVTNYDFSQPGRRRPAAHRTLPRRGARRSTAQSADDDESGRPQRHPFHRRGRHGERIGACQHRAVRSTLRAAQGRLRSLPR